MVHTPAARSTSAHSAPRTSPERVAVSTRNSKASFTASLAPVAHIVRIAPATSRWPSAGMCLTRSCCGPSTGAMRSHGLSARYPIATAHSITALMRWRSRRAVSGLMCHTRRSVSSTSALVTSRTAILPSRGKACCSRLESHCLACRGWRHPGRLSSHTRRAASAKVGAAPARRRSSKGSSPARAALRLAWARARASLSETRGKPPRPSSRRRPRMTIRWTQLRAPEAFTAR